MNRFKQHKPWVPLSLAIAALFIGMALGAFFIKRPQATQEQAAEPEILYWVAPMDPNFRKDQPGKSPMGMDLVPVYAEETRNSEMGVVRISPEVEHNLGVRTKTVTYRALSSVYASVGRIKYDENTLIHIHPRVSGWVDKLFVKATGDPVVGGKALYAIYSPQLVNAQEEYVLAIASNNQRLINSTEQRLRALHISENFIQTLKQNKEIQQSITFYGPQDGVIAELHIREGFFVEPGSHLLSVAGLDSVWLELDVLAQQLVSIQLGDKVEVSMDAIPGKQWQAKVSYIYPTLNPLTRTGRVRVDLKNTEGLLKPNMYAEARIHTRKSATALVIPKEALIRVAEQNRVVMALGEGRFKSVAVQVGRITQGYAEILSGVEEGDILVTSAQFLLDSESSKESDFLRMESHH